MDAQVSTLLVISPCCTSNGADESGAGSSPGFHHLDFWRAPGGRAVTETPHLLPCNWQWTTCLQCLPHSLPWHANCMEDPMGRRSNKALTSHLHWVNWPPPCYSALTCQPWERLPLPFKDCLLSFLLGDGELSSWDGFEQCLARGSLAWFQRGSWSERLRSTLSFWFLVRWQDQPSLHCGVFHILTGTKASLVLEPVRMWCRLVLRASQMWQFVSEPYRQHK